MTIDRPPSDPLSDPADAPAAIRVSGLTRTFDTVTAVAGVDLNVAAGAVFGLLGPDGAGKSTLIRMLATVLTPDSGEAEVFGYSVRRRAARITPLIGYMSQRFSLYPDLTVAENLDFFATIRAVPRHVRRERAQALLSGMGLAEFAGRRAAYLSGGMKQKLMLATTLMHEPDLLLLDEPTTGVDPVSRREFWRILADLHRAGKTVLVATPYMDEAERCTAIAFMQAGQIRHHGTPAQIKALVPGTLLEIMAPDPRAVLAAVAVLPAVASPGLYGDVVRLIWRDSTDGRAPLGARLGEAGLPFREIRAVPVDMETTFAYLAEQVAR